jgi:hypothetical protein
MGRQYGELLKEDLQRFYARAIEQHFINDKKISYDDMLAIGSRVYSLYPQRFKEIMMGMAETSGLTLNQHLVLNTVEWYDYMCSGLVAWDEFTGGASLVFGRNYDYPDHFRNYSEFVTVAVFHPDDVACATAIITFAGTIYATNGINEAGIFLELNNGAPSGGEITVKNRIPTEIQLFSFLLDSYSMFQLDAYLNSTYSSYPFIVTVADKNTAFTYEWPIYGIRRISGEPEGLLIPTNHFVDPAWDIEVTQSNKNSVLRRNNLMKIATANKGMIDVEKMKSIFDTTIPDGGATHPQRTIYQMVVVPESFTLWLKAPGVQEWTEIPLKSFLIPSN